MEYRCVSLGPYFRGFPAVFGTPKTGEYRPVFLSLGPELGPITDRPGLALKQSSETVAQPLQAGAVARHSRSGL